MERPKATDLQAQLSDALWDACPSDWPGRKTVDLDNIGDPSAWLRTVLPEPIGEWLINDAGQSDEEIASLLAEEYVIEIQAKGYPLPNDFADESEPNLKDDLATIVAEFREFICEWRKTIARARSHQ